MTHIHMCMYVYIYIYVVQLPTYEPPRTNAFLLNLSLSEEGELPVGRNFLAYVYAQNSRNKMEHSNGIDMYSIENASNPSFKIRLNLGCGAYSLNPLEYAPV